MKRIILGVVALALLLGCPTVGSGELPAAGPGGTGTDAQVTLVTNGWVDVRELLSNVAETARLGLQLAPDAQGMVNVHLENVSVAAALKAMLDPINLGYEIVDGDLIVYKQGLVTRWLTFDYPVTSREGRGELLISAGSTGGGGEGGGEAGSAENQSHVTSKASMSVWPMVVSAMKALVFSGTEADGGGLDEEGLSLSLADAAGRSLVVNAMAGLIQVTAEWDRVNRCAKLIERLEKSLLRQVAIEVKIFEVNLSDEFQTGIDWRAIADPKYQLNFESSQGLNPALWFTANTADISVMFEIVQEQGTLKVLSSPHITTLNNQKAVVRVVREEVFYAAVVQPAIVTNGVASEPVVEYDPLIYPIGVVLDVTPQIGIDNAVTLNVHPTISNIVDVVFSPNLDSQPVVAVRELDTVGTVGDGQTLVIAGLMSEFLDDTETGVPILKDIPLLGYLFKRKDQKKRNIELVVLLTPTIMDQATIDDRAKAAEVLIEEKL